MKEGIAFFLIAALLHPTTALGESAESSVEALLARMTPEEKVGQMLVSAFRSWKEIPPEEEATEENEAQNAPEAVPTTELNQEIRDCLARYHFGGVLLFAPNCRGALPESADVEAMVNTVENGGACVDAAKEADHVILVHRVYSAACLDPATGDGFSSGVFDRIIEARHAAGKTVLLVSCGLPYDAARFPEADAILLTYGASVMRALLPATGTESAYMPNLAAALCACFGQGDAPSGRLPVDLPTVDSQYQITNQILYAK